MSRINVLITGVGGGGHGRQILKALKLSQLPLHLVGTDMTEVSIGLYECHRAYYVPRASHDDYIPRLEDIIEREKIHVVFTGSEPELLKLADTKLKSKCRVMIDQKDFIELCMDKWRLYQYLTENGFDCPKSYIADSGIPEEAYDILPAIVKPIHKSGGSQNVFIAQKPTELEQFVKYLKSLELKPIIQQYVGSYKEEYTVGVMTNFDNGKFIGSIAVKRFILSGLSNRMRIENQDKSRIKEDLLAVSSGISQGYVDDYPEVRKACEKIALAMKLKGVMNVQCRKDGDKVYVFEINPRFSGTTYIRALCGYNEPEIAIRTSILHEHVGQVEYKYGLVARGLQERYVPKEDIKWKS